MMLGLLANIFPHGLNVDGANAERTVTGLPCEIGIRGVTLPKSLSENWEGCCGEGFWLWARRRSPSIPAAGCKDRANEAHRQKTRRPEGFLATGRLASLLLSRRSTRDILLRRASPSSLWRENSTLPNFQTGSYLFFSTTWVRLIIRKRIFKGRIQSDLPAFSTLNRPARAFQSRRGEDT